MNQYLEVLIEILKTITLVSILYVWVVRYKNIQNEFDQYNLPKWVRDFVGILKISFALMLQSSENIIIVLGSAGILLLMSAAVFTHFRVKNKLYKMLPALSLFSISLMILIYTL